MNPYPPKPDDTCLILKGNQVLSDPAVGTHSGDQTATFQGGKLDIPADWTVHIFYGNPQPSTNELNGQSFITRIDIVKPEGHIYETFLPMNPGQVANIQGDLSGVGDNYAVINTSVLVPQNGMTGNIGRIAITNKDFTFDHLPITFPVGNGAYDMCGCNGGPAPCFAEGTEIVVRHGGLVGPKAVEDMDGSEEILTADGTWRNIQWMGSYVTYLTARTRPVRIWSKGSAFIVSPQHLVRVKDPSSRTFWVRAKLLAEETDLADYHAVPPHADRVQYFHFLLDGHHGIVGAGRIVSESLYISDRSLALFRAADAAQIVREGDIGMEKLGPELKRKDLRNRGSDHWQLDRYNEQIDPLGDDGEPTAGYPPAPECLHVRAV